MTIQIYYDSLTQAATAFGCSRQWLSKLIAQGLLVSYEVEGQPQARRVFHQDVAEALARIESGLRPHNCVCYTVAHLQGIEEGRKESAPQLAKVQRELSEALEEFAKVKAERDKALEDTPPQADPVSWRETNPFSGRTSTGRKRGRSCRVTISEPGGISGRRGGGNR